MSSLTSCLPPYLSSSLASSLSSLPPSLSSLSSVVSSQLASLKSLGEDRLPEVVHTRLHFVGDQVIYRFLIYSW